MKANRKFLNNDDEAVSPVIAVILMVAITVVLAATVYVWVSGFGSQSSQPAKTMSLTSASALSSGGKTYTIAAATSGMKWSDISVTVDGASRNMTLASTNGGVPGTGTCAAVTSTGLGTATWQACGGNVVEDSSMVINAGDSFSMAGLSSGQTLRILDSQANSVILTLTVG